MRKAEVREIQLLEMLRNETRMEIHKVVNLLNVSEATARRMFASLERSGKLIRIHGGVQIAPQSEADYSYRVSMMDRQSQKLRIGEAAAELVGDNESIFLDSGTTVLKFAQALALRIRTGKLKDIITITNSISYLESLATCCKVILVGGVIRPERRDVCGATAEANLSRFQVDKAFMGADAINHKGAFMTTDEETARMNEIVIERANKSFVLADSEKFARRSLVAYATFEQIDTVITDNGISQTWVDIFRAEEVSSIVV